jgi:hypothetical protein
MKILLFIMLSFGLLSAKTNETFKNAVSDNYQYYQEVIAEETAAVRIDVYLGLIGEQFSLSIFYEEVNSSQNHHLLLIAKGKTSTLASSSSRGYFYKRKVDKGETVQLQIVSGAQNTLFKQYDDIDIPSDVNAFKQTASQGKGLNEFPSSTWTLKLSTLMIIGILVFLGLSMLFVIILLIVFRKKKGIFSQKATEQRMKRFENVSFYYGSSPNSDESENEEEEEHKVWDIDPNDYTVDYEDKKTKDEQIDELFKAYKAGKISESDLNAALRAIWAEEDDRDENK